MTKMLRNLIRGASTALTIMPPARHARIGEGLPHSSDADALYGDWKVIGDHLRSAIDDAARKLTTDGKPKQA